MTFEERVYRKEFMLNDTDDIIIDYIRKNEDKIVNVSIHTVSSDLFLSPNSIMRLCKKLGYSGFSELKFSLNKPVEGINTTTNVILEQVPESILRTLDIIDNDIKEAFVQNVLKAEKILFVGVGESTFYCESMGRSLRFIGINTEYYQHIHDMDFISGKLTSKDLVIFVSARGQNDRILKIARHCDEKKINTVAITKYGKNPLADLCDYQLCYWSNEKNYQDYTIVDRSGLAMLCQILVEDVYKKVCV